MSVVITTKSGTVSSLIGLELYHNWTRTIQSYIDYRVYGTKMYLSWTRLIYHRMTPIRVSYIAYKLSVEAYH